MGETQDPQFPIPSLGSGIASQGDPHLTTSDGNRPLAYFARASNPCNVGVVVIPARMGLLRFYRTLTGRFAELGIDAVALDLYGRTATDHNREAGFNFTPHYEILRREEAWPGINVDIKAAVDFLKSPTGGSVESAFTLGFCFGGSVSWWQSATEPRLNGCIGLYGGPQYVKAHIPYMRKPLLLLNAGADTFISHTELDTFEDELRTATVTFKTKTYPSAPHSFFDRHHAQHLEAASDAWEQILGFIKQHASNRNDE